jgi:hypothetical protein
MVSMQDLLALDLDHSIINTAYTDSWQRCTPVKHLEITAISSFGYLLLEPDGSELSADLNGAKQTDGRQSIFLSPININTLQIPTVPFLILNSLVPRHQLPTASSNSIYVLVLLPSISQKS